MIHLVTGYAGKEHIKKQNGNYADYLPRISSGRITSFEVFAYRHRFALLRSVIRRTAIDDHQQNKQPRVTPDHNHRNH